MLWTATIALVGSALLSMAAILCVSRSVATSRFLLPIALAATVIGTPAIAMAGSQGAPATWAFFFACGASGCTANAARNLNSLRGRWVHRSVIYAGYGATFAAMGVAGLWLARREASGGLAAAVFIGVFAVGSAGIFLAKTLTVRHAIRTMPGYQASLAEGRSGPDDPGYWWT
jgi:hypothetical protein